MPARPEDFRRYIARRAALLGDRFILGRDNSETEVSDSHIILIIGVHMID